MSYKIIYIYRFLLITDLFKSNNLNGKLSENMFKVSRLNNLNEKVRL